MIEEKLSLYEELLKNGKVLPGITDVVFKKIMTTHKDYLAFILEKILPLTKEEIEQGEFLNIEIPPSNIKEKLGRMDLLLRVGKYYINLEANTSINPSLLIRNKAHFSGLIFQEYTRKEKKTLEEILYQVAINKTKRLSDELIVKMQFWDKELNVGEEKIYKIEINLAYVNQKYYNKEKMSRYEKALLMLLIEDEKELREIMEGDYMLEEVGKDIISYSRAKEIVTAYVNEMIEENYRNNLAREEGYDKGHEEGLEQGHKEGIKQGLKEGLEQGLEQGIEQGIEQNKIEVAKSMLKDNQPVEIISKYTHLSLDEIKVLMETK